MSLDHRLAAVIQAFYDAALDETTWPVVLQHLTDLTGSQAATFWVLDGSGQPRLPMFITRHFDPNFIAEYLDGMVPLDPTVQYLVGHPNEPIVHDGLVITERDKERSAYYDWHGRHSDTRFRLVGQSCPGPVAQAGVALHRTRRAGRYEPKDIEQFRFLHAHLERALKIAFRIGSIGTMQQCTIELLDRSPAAVVFLDEQRRIVYANRRAAAFHMENDGISMAGDNLTLAWKADHDTLQALIGRALSAIGAPAETTMRALRPSGKRPYSIAVSRVSPRQTLLSALRPAVCIVIVDPEAARSLPIDRLRSAFGLTAAEARLAALLAEGEELKNAAGKLGITYGTARVRLAEIFQKTHTRRQGELITLLLTTLAPII